MPGGVLRRDLATGALFVLLWLVPVAHAAFAGYPARWLPPNLRDLYSVTCLFRHRTTEHVLFYPQVRYAGRRGWHDVDETEYFPMQPFGHRSRFDRFMARFGYAESAGAARLDLARWLAARHRALHPDADPIVAVRFVWARQPIDASSPPSGSWHKPSIDAVRSGSRVLDVHVLDAASGAR